MVTSKVAESTYPLNYWVPAIILVALQIYFLTRDGQSIGKKILDIRIVMNDSGVNGGFVPNVLLRVFVNTIFALVPLYGLVDILFIARHDYRCIHDLLAGTVVIEPVKIPPVGQF
ncbi:MAG: RDD family protein [bacterium]|nr:RDD family protein [bacterium]